VGLADNNITVGQPHLTPPHMDDKHNARLLLDLTADHDSDSSSEVLGSASEVLIHKTKLTDRQFESFDLASLEDIYENSESSEDDSCIIIDTPSKPILKRQNATLLSPREESSIAVIDHLWSKEYLEPEPTTQPTPTLNQPEEETNAPAVVEDPDIHTINPHEDRDRFRIQGKYFFLTWPQCSTPKETVLTRLSYCASFDYAVVCREDHKDATGEHLHAFVAWQRQQNKKGYKWIDDLADSHGNYQTAKNNTKVIKYVIKHGDYVSSPGFDPVEWLRQAEQKKTTSTATPTGKTTAKITNLIRDEGFDIWQLDEIHPGFVFHNKRKIQEYSEMQALKKIRLSLQPYPKLNLDDYPSADDPTYIIAKWLIENVRLPTRRPLKTKQLYIWSRAPDCGKSHLVQELSKYLSIYNMPRSDYMDGYESNKYDLVVCDEFRTDHTIQFLNEFVQGSTMHLNQKFGGHVKTDNPPMIFLANMQLEDIFWKKSRTDPFRALVSRFLIIEIPEKYKIDVFKQL